MGMKDFMGSLNYASCNEDWRSEWEALKLTPEDNVLCITGSGDRPLDLLPKDPRKVVSIDLNPVQNHLLRLKMAAMRGMPYGEYGSFLGLTDGGDRIRSWERIEDRIPEDTKAFWRANRRVLEKGVIYQGRWEGHFRKLALITKVMRGSTLRKLFEFEDVEEQRAFIKDRWDKWWWRKTFDVLCSASFSKAFFGDPGFYQFVSRDMTLGEYVFEGMNDYLLDHLARKSFMVSLVFLGKLSMYDLPPYLDPTYVPMIVERMDCIKIRRGNILELMESVPKGSFTKFSLSDVPSFMDQKDFERLLDGIHRSGAPGARFCIRLFLSDQNFPERFKDKLVREPELEERLRKEDSSFAYRFIVGRVVKDV
jgi:S-adenosylmethionine-diacylglycerol 3-amino-3-carboxypropyl transferase